MQPGPISVARLILDTHSISAEPEDVIEIIVRIILEQEWESHRTLALEKAERWKVGVLQKLNRELNALSRIGRPCRIEINSSNDEILQGASFIAPNDPPDICDQKRRRETYSEYQRLIQELSPAEFEVLCKRFIEIIGVEKGNVTRSVADDGVDFYGRIRGESVFFPRDLYPTIQKQLSIWIVGQAKQYLKSITGTPEVRDLVGAVMLGRSGAISTDISAFPELNIRVSDPVFCILVTGGRFSSRAWTLLMRSGVIGVDGEILAAFLADRRAGPDGELNPDTFREWLGLS